MNKNKQFQNKKVSHLEEKSSRIKKNESPNRYEYAEVRYKTDMDNAHQLASKHKAREESALQAKKSYDEIVKEYNSQQKGLQSRPKWRNDQPKIPTVGHSGRRRGDIADHKLVTNVTWQLKNINDIGDKVISQSETQDSLEWLQSHDCSNLKITLKDLMMKAKSIRPNMNPETSKLQQHLQFEAADVNDFEYRLNKAIESYTKRMKWLLQGSRRVFGVLKRSHIAVLVDMSDANCGFGRLANFQTNLIHLLDEQLVEMKSIYLASFGSEFKPLWEKSIDANIRTIAQAKQWVNEFEPMGGFSIVKSLEQVFKRKHIDCICLIVGSIPEALHSRLIEFVTELTTGRNITIHAVAYDCCHGSTHEVLKKIAVISGGRYQCYDSASEEQIYSSSDINLLLKEVQNAQKIINKIIEMRHGMLGTALVSVLNQISTEVSKLPQSRFLPRPVGHDLPLTVEMSNFLPSSSDNWLQKHSLKALGQDLYQFLSPNTYQYKEEFVSVIGKTVQSLVHQKAMAQFEWHDGSIRNVHVDLSAMFEYQKQLGATVKLYEQRLEWLAEGSRKIFGSIGENSLVIIIDVSSSNTNYLIHIQHSMRILLEQQLSNRQLFNIIAMNDESKAWKPTLMKTTEDNLQDAWRWILMLQCGGTRNFMSALRLACENEEEMQHSIEVEGIYLFTSGVPDQNIDVCNTYAERTCVGRYPSRQLHVILYNVDDYSPIDGSAIPSRYANITATATGLRSLAHTCHGRFHWFRENGIIESDDISLISEEIEKAISFSKKCSLLVDSVKKKYNIESPCIQSIVSNCKLRDAIPEGNILKALQPPKHTVLSQSRMEIGVSGKMKPAQYRPSTLSSPSHSNTIENGITKRHPMKRVSKDKKEFFYTENKNAIATVSKTNTKKPMRYTNNCPIIPEKESQVSSKEWFRLYSLSKLKLDMNKLANGSLCKHIPKSMKTSDNISESRACSIFPTINICGAVKHLELMPNELKAIKGRLAGVLQRYLKRLQWLLAGSRATFGNIVEDKVVFLIDTSGSMDSHMDSFKQQLISLIWEQLFKHNISFNLIAFSRKCHQWKNQVTQPSEQNCHDAVKWISSLTAQGNTCTLDALELAFEDSKATSIYLLSDGKPDCSTSLVTEELSNMNQQRNLVVNTISFNCDDITANNALKMMSKHNNGRFHKYHRNFDGKLFAHTLLNSGFRDYMHPQMPAFEGDDLRRLCEEIALARKYIFQCQSYIVIYEEMKAVNKEIKMNDEGFQRNVICAK